MVLRSPTLREVLRPADHSWIDTSARVIAKYVVLRLLPVLAQGGFSKIDKLTFLCRTFIQPTQLPTKFQASERWRSKRSGESTQPKLSWSATVQTQTCANSSHRESLGAYRCLHGSNTRCIHRRAAIQPEPGQGRRSNPIARVSPNASTESGTNERSTLSYWWVLPQPTSSTDVVFLCCNITNGFVNADWVGGDVARGCGHWVWLRWRWELFRVPAPQLRTTTIVFPTPVIFSTSIVFPTPTIFPTGFSLTALPATKPKRAEAQRQYLRHLHHPRRL